MENYPRRAGTLVPVFALRRAGDFGIGDTLALQEAIYFCAEQKIELLQLLPVNETGDDNSPYNAISSIALDPVYLTLTPEYVPGLTSEILAEFAPESVLAPLRSGPVRYREVKRLKQETLAQAYVNFEAEEIDQNTALGLEFAEFRQNHQIWLESYTMFRTLLNEYEGDAVWTSWEEAHQSFEEAATWIQMHPDREELERYRIFCAYLQWVSWRQWYAVRETADTCGVRLIGDIPFGISRYSADVWAHRFLFDLDWSGGAPPEPFFSGDKFLRQWGQNWGIPLYDWSAHRAQDFYWWRQRVVATGAIFHAFRIDHVLGFFRIWSFPWIPQRNLEFIDQTEAQVKAKTGGYVPQFNPGPDEPEASAEVNAAQGEELLGIVLQAAGVTAVVAEDLGLVPTYVPEVLQKLQLPGFYIPYFVKDKKTHEYAAATEIPELSIATWGTHDHAPLRAWYEDLTAKWKGPNGHEPWLELQRIMRFIGWDENAPPEKMTPELHRALLDALLRSPARWTILTICDIINIEMRFNQPGTATDDNWSQRLPQPLTELATDPQFAPKFAQWRESVAASGRTAD